jgi:hypothetical protein
VVRLIRQDNQSTPVTPAVHLIRQDNQSTPATPEQVQSSPTFMSEKIKVASEYVDAVKFKRVHRIGLKGNGRCRKIVAKFTLFKEREFIKKKAVENSREHAVFCA